MANLEPKTEHQDQNEQPENASWLATSPLQFLPDMTRQQMASMANSSFESGLNMEAMHLLMTMSRKYYCDLDTSEKLTLYWSWDRMIQQKIKIWEKLRDSESLARGQGNNDHMGNGGYLRVSTSTAIWKTCQLFLAFVRECLNVYDANSKASIFFQTLLAEIHWMQSIILDGLEGNPEVHGATRRECDAIAYATYVQFESKNTFSNLVNEYLCFKMSYTKYLRGKGQEGKAFKVVSRVVDDVKACRKQGKKAVADERGQFMLQILEQQHKELKQATRDQSKQPRRFY